MFISSSDILSDYIRQIVGKSSQLVLDIAVEHLKRDKRKLRHLEKKCLPAGMLLRTLKY